MRIRDGFVALLLAVGACASGIDVKSYHDPTADFSGLKSYAWLAPKDAGDPNINDAFLAENVQAAVDRELEAKGLRRTAKAPDFRVGHYAVLQRKVAVSRVDEAYGHGTGTIWNEDYRPKDPGGPEGQVREYNEGTLILDVTDAESGRLLWRGMAMAQIYGTDRPEARKRKINAAVKKVLARFPPE